MELAIIVLYLVGMIVVGVVVRGKVRQADDFFVAGRRGSSLLITGSLLATIMDLPAVTVVIELKIEGGTLKAEREIDGAHELFECQLPAIVSAQRGLNEPRFASLRGIMGSKKAHIEEVDIELKEEKLKITGFEYPPRKAEGKIFSPCNLFH